MARWAWVLVVALGCSGSGTGGRDGSGDDLSVLDDARDDLDSVDKDAAVPDAGDAIDLVPDGQVPCTEGEHACLDEAVVSVCVGGVFQFSTTCTGEAFCLDGACARLEACTPGASTACDGLTTHWVCAPDGTAVALLPCPDGTMCAAGQCRVVACTPGAGQCLDTASMSTCLPDGSGYGPPQECANGQSCVGGRCLSLCEADLKQNTNTGCQYWSVDLDNDPTHNPGAPNQPTPEMFPHSVVISNPNSTEVTMAFSVVVACANDTFCSASVTTCNGQLGTVCDKAGAAEYALNVGDPVVPAGQSREFKMPVMNVSGSVKAPKAIRVLASRPVVAYQFNPFNSENAASNDGSLLLPQNALGKLYYAVSLPSRGAIMGFPENNGFVTVVATAPNTTVKVTPPVKLIANPEGGVGLSPAPMLANQTYTFTLQLFDVLNLEQSPETKVVPPGTIPGNDLTGTRVEADKPVAVFSGHQVAGVQEAMKMQMTDVWDSCCTEHLEEQLMPVETWGTEAFCVKSKPRGYEADRFVVVAGEDGVQLTTEPFIDGLDGVTLTKAGDVRRIETADSFVLKATGKIQVVQFLMSAGQTQSIGGEPPTGDPSMMLLPPSAQYRDAYVINTADGYSTNWTTVIRPAGLPIMADGVAMPDGAFEPLGDGSWQFAYHPVTNGNHAFTASQAFGLMVYGYGTVTAYGYPGGMNLVQ